MSRQEAEAFSGGSTALELILPAEFSWFQHSAKNIYDNGS